MIFRMLDRVLDVALVTVLGLMVGIVALNVFCRFVLNFSLYWGDEAAQALLVWLTFLGAAVGVRDRAHPSFDYLARVSPPRLQVAVGVTSRMIMIGAIVGLLYWTAIVAWRIQPWIMPALQISRMWVYLAAPVGCALMLAYAVRDLRRIVREKRVEEHALEAV